MIDGNLQIAQGSLSAFVGSGGIVEIQGTAEKTPFTEAQLLALLALARKGVGKLVDLQKMAVM